MFDLDRFVADCRAAVAADPSHKLAREVVARAVAEPAALLKGLGEPKLGHVDTLYQSNDLTILNVVWPPLFTIMPHEHRMWAVIGVYAGAEDNMYWRRVGEPGRGPATAKSRRWAPARCASAMPNPWAATSSTR
jgi:predicted metal-dependent enzyme (double-stranded beta helix superfamily)